MHRNQLSFIVARDITSARDDLRIYSALYQFARSYRPRKTLFQSFIVIFRGPRTLSEPLFEASMWKRLQSLTDKDSLYGQRHNPEVSADPTCPHFSLSFGGEAFFCVGLHPGGSRTSRKFSLPALAFNLHDQFESMRKNGLYEKFRTKILERDLRYSGDTNPMLARFGETSEAMQYSGRAHGANWLCPFHR